MKYFLIGAVIVLIMVFLFLENTLLVTSHHHLDITKGAALKIAHLSDIHNTKNLSLQRQIIKKLKSEQPDIIVITGDLIDSRRRDVQAACDFIRKFRKLAPIYYVPGNHEARGQNSFSALTAELEKLNVITLLDENILVKEKINLIGIKDPRFYHPNKDPNINGQRVLKTLKPLVRAEFFNLLLTHRPELIDYYESSDIDLALCGHAHGGQIRLPYFGGLFAPGQGALPKLTSGMHLKGRMKMIISRGIGNSLFPFRIFNRPELVIITMGQQL